MTGADRIAVALDLTELDEAEELARRLAGHVGWFKVGLELFGAYGPDAVRAIRAHGPVFLDVKLHDIPTTVGRAASRLGALDVGLVTVHALGGEAMVRAAVDGLGSAGRVLAVTVLTSMSRSDLDAVGLEGDDHVERLAGLAVGAGAPGLVCAPGHLDRVRATVGTQPLVVTPGVRPAGDDNDDHAEVTTPAEAVRRGADLVVVGRPITRAKDPVAAARSIADSLASVG